MPTLNEPVLNTRRQFSEVHIDEDCRSLKGRFVNALFYNCRFGNMTGLELINCVLDHSTFEATDPRDALGFSVTLNCHSFKDVRITPELFDLLLLMLCKTQGNEEKRKKIVNDIIGTRRTVELLKTLRHLE